MNLLNRLDLIVIGAAKAGTTSFEHIFMAQPRAVIVGRRKPIFGENTDPRNYLTVVDSLSQLSSDKVTCHIRADYMLPDQSLREIDRRTQAKILMICRDPAARLWSHYWHNFKKGRRHTAQGFEHWLKSTDGQKAKKLSNYGQALNQVFEIFSRERVMVLCTEDLRSIEKINSVFSGLGIYPISDLPLQLRNVSRMPRYPALTRAYNRLVETLPAGRTRNTAIKFRNSALTGRSRAPLLPNNTRQDLIGLYSNDIELFQELSGRDVSHWMK
jgi:hypothetical protein